MAYFCRRNSKAGFHFCHLQSDGFFKPYKSLIITKIVFFSICTSLYATHFIRLAICSLT